MEFSQIKKYGPAIEQEMTNDIPSTDCTTCEPKYPRSRKNSSLSDAAPQKSHTSHAWQPHPRTSLWAEQPGCIFAPRQRQDRIGQTQKVVAWEKVSP